MLCTQATEDAGMRRSGSRGPDALAQLWVFLVAPAVGGLIAGFTWKPLFGRR